VILSLIEQKTNRNQKLIHNPQEFTNFVKSLRHKTMKAGITSSSIINLQRDISEQLLQQFEPLRLGAQRLQRRETQGSRTEPPSKSESKVQSSETNKKAKPFGPSCLSPG